MYPELVTSSLSNWPFSCQFHGTRKEIPLFSCIWSVGLIHYWVIQYRRGHTNIGVISDVKHRVVSIWGVSLVCLILFHSLFLWTYVLLTLSSGIYCHKFFKLLKETFCHFGDTRMKLPRTHTEVTFIFTCILSTQWTEIHP